MAEHLADRVKAIPGEVYEHVADRVLPQGAAELAHALNAGSAYLPYGPGQRAGEIEQAHGVHGPQASAAPAQPEVRQTNDRGLEM